MLNTEAQTARAAPPQTDAEPRLVVETVATPIGELTTLTCPEGLILAASFRGVPPPAWLKRWYGESIVLVYDQGESSPNEAPLRKYFEGDLEAIRRIAQVGAGTDFQRSVWSELLKVEAGRTDTYSGIAHRIGRPTAIRAVGLANGANPIPIIVPCHRIVGSNGSLTGYGSGLDRKRWLLDHELRHARAR